MSTYVHPASRLVSPTVTTWGPLYVIGYVLLDWVTYVQPVFNLGITPWNPQAGLTLAFLIVFGPKKAWLTAIAAASAELLVRHGETPTWVIPLLATTIAICYGQAGAILRSRGFLDSIASPVKVLWLIGVGAVASLLVAFVYVGFFTAIQRLPSADLLSNVSRYSIGDLNGVLAVTPLLLALPHWRKGLNACRARLIEVAMQFAALLISLWAIFGLRIGDLRFSYPVFIPAIWIAFRWGFTGTVLSLLTIQIAFVAAAANDVSFSFIDVQIRLLSLSVTVMLLAAAVTERFAADSQLRERDRALARATRFAVAGELTSALAHELNQPITALVSYTRAAQILAKPIAENDTRLSSTLDKAASQAIRAADVLKKLRDFYRSGTSEQSQVDVRKAVDAVAKSSEERLLNSSIRYQCLHDQALPRARFDATQLEMILHNLLNNAIEAMASGDQVERVLVVTTAQDKDSILVTVSDSGPGIAAEVRAQLFEPFVTTKSDGMGLGLALGRSLLRSQGGDLWAEDSELGGARFVARMNSITVAAT